MSDQSSEIIWQGKPYPVTLNWSKLLKIQELFADELKTYEGFGGQNLKRAAKIAEIAGVPKDALFGDKPLPIGPVIKVINEALALALNGPSSMTEEPEGDEGEGEDKTENFLSENTQGEP